MNSIQRTAPALAALGVLACTTAGAADFGPIGAAVAEAKFLFDARARFEGVDQDPLADEAEALTLRTRLGIETGKAWGTALLVEGDFLWPLTSDYNSTVNGKGAYPVVADPETYELNRLQLTNTAIDGTTITLGRQRILLDDHRFVGNVGWRQNEQTFDSLRVVNRTVANLTVDVAYVSQVNRVFGKDSPQGRYEGDSVLANVSYDLPFGKLTGFGYWLEFDPIAGVPAAAGDSSSTAGLRLAGERPLADFKVGYMASYATQRDAGDNPLDFSNDYYLVELTGSYGRYSLGAGIEVLEGDGVKGFTTPLATLHKFQGWADKFLVTPAGGIDDRYVNAGFTFKGIGPLESLSALASYHFFESQSGSTDYGKELDLQVLAKWRRFTGLLKYADYAADELFSDTTKFWVQLEYVW